ncbi:unnamed protein product [Trichobilharzia regenti]|nr:unnamed protein product [Trichobilharzia regenti]
MPQFNVPVTELRVVSPVVGNGTTVASPATGGRPQHRVLARRKYGICSPPACLEELTQALISQQQQHQQQSSSMNDRDITDDENFQ